MSPINKKKRHLRATLGALAVMSVSATMLTSTAIPSVAAPIPHSDRAVLHGLYWGDVPVVAFAAPDGEGGRDVLSWCTQYFSPAPSSRTASTGVDRLVSESKMWGPSEVDLTTPQMAWLLDRVNKDYLAGKAISPVDVTAVAYLVHANFEMPDPDTGHPDPQATIRDVTATVQNVTPEAWTRALALAAEARGSAAVGYTNSTVPREEVRHGVIQNIAVTNSAGGNVSGVPMRLVLEGPAVFDETGTSTWTGTSASAPSTLTWTATGNGRVSYKLQWQGQRDKLTRFLYGPGVQNTLSLPHGDPRWVDGPARMWNVVYDFQPIATSNVKEAKVVDEAGKLTDTLTVSADPSYSNPSWIVDDAGNPVPVVFEGTAYYTGDTPAEEADTAPEGVMVAGTATITAAGPGDYTATLDAPGGVNPEFVTWVWTMKKNAQTAKATFGGVEYTTSDLVHADWSDRYGIAEETSSLRKPATIDSSLSIRETKSGTYLVDDLFVEGMPDDHPAWPGGAGFKADVKTMSQSLLFFPKGLDVTEANKTRAEVIGTVSVPAANGFYPSVGSTKFKMKEGAQGTYVFVTSFAGDDRVQPLTTSVEDVNEQYVTKPEPPTLHTTATDKADGDKTLATSGEVTITDRVCYTNLTPGKTYELTGTLMDKDTGAALEGADGKPIQATVSHTPIKDADCADVDFTVDGALLIGKRTVVFERLLEEGRTIAVHTDINDEGQTVQTPPVDLGTTATDGEDGDKTVHADADVTINDEVCYTNLTPGKEYTLTGTLMDADTGQSLMVGGQAVTASRTFTPSEANGCETVTFTLDGSALMGKRTVVFESLLHEGREIAVHADITDEGQTVTVDGGDSDSGLAATGADVAGIAFLALLAAAGGGTLLMRRRRSVGSEVA